MPLNPSQLADDLAAIGTSPPATAAEAAQLWAEAIGSYASGIIPPSTTVSTAESALATALAGAFASPAAAPLMETAMLSFATTVASGMAPLYTGTPPAGPVGFAIQFAGPKPATHEAMGSQLSSLIDAWMKTGTATLVAPPNTVVPWS